MTGSIRDWLGKAGGLVTGSQPLTRTLALTVGGLLLAALLLLSMSAVELLREQAEQQALSRVQLAGMSARDGVRQLEEDALTAARTIAVRVTLARLIREGNREQTELFLRRACEVVGMTQCAVIVGPGTVLAATRADLPWAELVDATGEQGEHFMLAPAAVPEGVLGAIAPISNLVETRVVVLRFLDERVRRRLAESAGMDVRLVRVSGWLDDVQPDLREMHSSAISTGTTSSQRIDSMNLYASSTPVIAATGEGVTLIETRLPASGVDTSVGRFVERLVWTALLLGLLAVAAAVLIARRIVAPLRALAESATKLGLGDLSTSIPASGGPETVALARTLEEMRRNLVDVTATLRRREAEAQAMLRGVVEGVFAVDGERRIRYLNPQAEAIAGIAPGEAIGRFCGDVLKPCADKDGQRPCGTSCPILSAREQGQAQATEFLERADGGRRTVIIAAARMVDGLQVQVMRDETGLESARRARDSILANISHEFRTPLAAQLASLELLQENLPTLPREELKSLVDTLQRGTLRLTRLIDNLLESVRIESGQLGIRSQRLAIADVVREAAEMVESLLAQSNQSLEVSIAEDLPELVGDAPRLTQVFVNLLANANKFGPEGSTIRITGEATASEVQVSVEDEGPGIVEAASGAIFERFYRSADQEPEPRGLGLGLWIVKSIVDRHGGRVSAERTEAGRTRFTVTLPLPPPDSQS
jgi:signal transduction histidine kinase